MNNNNQNDNLIMGINTYVNNTAANNNDNINELKELDIEKNILPAFISKNENVFTDTMINIPALLLGELYYFYRKMYLYGFIIFFIKLALAITLNNLIIPLIINIPLMFATNAIYMSFARHNAKRLKKSNFDLLNERVLDLASKKGSPSIANILGGALIEVLITVITIIVLSLVGYETSFTKYTDPIKDLIFSQIDTKQIENITKYKTTYKITIDTESEMKKNFTIPEGFIETKTNTAYKALYKATNKTCTASLQKLATHETSQVISEKLAKNYGTTVEKLQKGKLTWYGVKSTNNGTIKYEYLLDDYGVVYYFTYIIADENDANECIPYIENIIYSINI